jgi:hypothetical protein
MSSATDSGTFPNSAPLISDGKSIEAFEVDRLFPSIGRRPCDALEVLGPEVLQLEEITEESSRALSDDDRIRLGDALKARREIRRLAHDSTFLGVPGPGEIADYDQAGRNADAHLERLFRAQLADSFDQREPSSHRPLGVVLVRARIAEISKHPVAHVPINEPAVALDQFSAAAVEGANDARQILGVEFGRQRSRADQVTKHDS